MQKVTVALICQVLALQSMTVFSGIAYADLPAPTAAPLSSDASGELPIVRYPENPPAAEYTTPDDELDFSEAQNQRAAEVFVTQQKEVIQDVLDLAMRLEVSAESRYMELGAAKIAEYQAILALPERNIFERTIKSRKLQKFEYKLEGLDLTSSSSIRSLGESVYRTRAIRGTKIEELRITVDGVGKVEPSNLQLADKGQGNLIFPRVVHEKSGVAFLVLPEGVDLDSQHLRQYLARIRSQSNRGKGRPVVILQVGHSSVENKPTFRYQFHDRPKGLKEKIVNGWHANYVKPDFGIAAVSVMIQIPTTLGLSYIQYVTGHTPEFELFPTLLTTGYAFIFGAYGSFYNNITTPNDPNNRVGGVLARMAISSLTFAYALQIYSHGLSSVSLLTTGGWMKNLALVSNSYVNNSVKDVFKVYNEGREDMGLNRGKVKMAGREFKQTQLERQLTGEVPRLLKMTDLMGFTGQVDVSVPVEITTPAIPITTITYDEMAVVQVKVPEMNFDFGIVKLIDAVIPFGSLAFYSSYIWGQLLVVKYFEKKGYERAAELRARYERTISSPMRAIEWAMDTVQGKNGTPKDWLQTAWAKTLALAQRLHLTKANCPDIFEGKGQELLNKQDKTPPFRPSQDGQWIEISP